MTRLRMKDLPPAQRKQFQEARRRGAQIERETFQKWCAAAGLAVPVPEHRFARPEREWRFDWAWPEQRVALEIEGGAFSGGRHTRGAGFREDLRKYSEAAARGWRIVRVMPEDLYEGSTLDYLRRALMHY